MKFRVFVYYRKGILDPEAETILKTINNMGYENISGASRGKFFDIEINDNSKSLETIEEIGLKILSNPVIEDFKIEKLGI